MGGCQIERASERGEREREREGEKEAQRRGVNRSSWCRETPRDQRPERAPDEARQSSNRSGLEMRGCQVATVAGAADLVPDRAHWPTGPAVGGKQ